MSEALEQPRTTDTKRATLYRMATDEHICPFGLKAKDLLKRRGYSVVDEMLTTREATDAFKTTHSVETTPQVFIDGQRIGGYDELREFLGLPASPSGEVSYRPIVAIFSMTLLMALSLEWATNELSSPIAVGESFIALSMCVLAILKLRDLESFANQFLGYDLLARRLVRYAYVYPFAEAFAGVGMLAEVFDPLVSATALFIGGVGAASVVKAVYIEGRELRCACVGGNSNVPLGFISLTENLMMILMGARLALG